MMRKHHLEVRDHDRNTLYAIRDENRQAGNQEIREISCQSHGENQAH